MVVMLVWRILNCKSSKAAMVLMSCPGLLLDKILIIASNPNSFTSTSAKQDLFSAVSSRSPVSKSMNLIWSLGRELAEAKGGKTGCWWGCGTTAILLFVDESPTCLWASPKILLLFCDSKHWSSCSSSLTNSIAPPMIEAWSPYEKFNFFNFSWK